MQQHTHQEPTFPLAELAMQFLVKSNGEQPLAFVPQGPRALEVGLEALFASGTPVNPALDELLGLALVLEDDRHSPTAARLIRQAVQHHPRAMAALGLSNGDALRLKRGAARVTGGNESERAPVFGSAVPVGAKKASSMIDPLQLERARRGGRPGASKPLAPKVEANNAERPSTTRARRGFDVS
ncbi:MAG: hypothetical protein IPG45_21695 [Deltaproteobacteria bacterium]|nr:hypothetical protein [Deltaproteobacteria bacterium]